MNRLLGTIAVLLFFVINSIFYCKALEQENRFLEKESREMFLRLGAMEDRMAAIEKLNASHVADTKKVSKVYRDVIDLLKKIGDIPEKKCSRK